MRCKPNKALMAELGLSHGQIRTPYVHKNLWWSFDHDRLAFGYGDLDALDLKRIYDWVSQESNGHRAMIFTGWNEHHGTEFQQTEHAIVRISFAAGITNPHNARLDLRYATK